MTIKVKIKKIHPDAKLPTYAHDGDAAMDVYAVEKNVTDKYIEYKTGLKFEVPKNYVMLVFPRSSISNKDLLQSNSVGVLDSGYRGELLIRFKKFGDDVYEVGERVAQIMIVPYPEIEMIEVEELSESERGEGGWGSTGK